MKKITIKTIAFLTLTLLAFQVQAQGNAYPSQTDGTFKIKVEGEDLYLTLPNMDPPVFGAWEQNLTYEVLNTVNPELQTFNVTWDSATCTACYFIESVIPGRGLVELLDTTIDTSPLGVKGNTSAAPSPDQLDRWNPTRGSGTQLFSENISTTASWAGKAKRRVQNTSSPDPLLSSQVKVSGGTPLLFSWEAVTLSNKKFDTSSVFISNPVENVLTVSGLTDSVNKISVYSLLGQEVLERKIDGQINMTINISNLTSGLYIVKLSGENGSISKKIIKE